MTHGATAPPCSLAAKPASLSKHAFLCQASLSHAPSPPVGSRCSPRQPPLDKVQLNNPRPTSSVSNPSPPASAPREHLICSASMPVAARRGLTTPMCLSPPPPQFPFACARLLKNLPYLLSTLSSPPLSLVNHRAMVFYFSAATAAVGSASYRPCPPCLGSTGSPHGGAAHGPTGPISPSPERHRIRSMPPTCPNLGEILPQVLFRLKLMW
jgi:hypothetical protein